MTLQDFQQVRVIKAAGNTPPGAIGSIVESYPATADLPESYLVDFSWPPGDPVADVLPVDALETVLARTYWWPRRRLSLRRRLSRG